MFRLTLFFISSLIVFLSFKAEIAEAQQRAKEDLPIFMNIDEPLGEEAWSKGLTNAQTLALIRMYVYAEKLPDGDKKKLIAEKIYNLTGVNYITIGDNTYVFGSPDGYEADIYISEEEANCAKHIVEVSYEETRIVAPAKVKARIIPPKKVKKECQTYIAKMVSIYGLKLEE